MTLDQLILDLPHRAAHGAEDCLVTSINFRFWHFSDISPALTNVGYRG